MKIKFLGTSYGAPTKRRHQQCILVESGENSYLIDAGAPVLDVLINSSYDLKKIKAIFLSHLHGDHINGIFDILNLAEYYEMNFTVFVPEEIGIKLFEDYCNMQEISCEKGSFSLKIITEGKFFDDGNLSVGSVLTEHMKETERPSFGFMIENKERKVFVTGDLHHTLKDFPEILYSECTDMVITECTHFSPESILEKLEKCKTKNTAIIHVLPKKYVELEKCKKDASLDIILPKDNDEYII